MAWHPPRAASSAALPLPVVFGWHNEAEHDRRSTLSMCQVFER
jgi:hypothetical protein